MIKASSNRFLKSFSVLATSGGDKEVYAIHLGLETRTQSI